MYISQSLVSGHSTYKLFFSTQVHAAGGWLGQEEVLKPHHRCMPNKPQSINNRHCMHMYTQLLNSKYIKKSRQFKMSTLFKPIRSSIMHHVLQHQQGSHCSDSINASFYVVITMNIIIVLINWLFKISGWVTRN